MDNCLMDNSLAFKKQSIIFKIIRVSYIIH
jgi:hypothetical protein